MFSHLEHIPFGKSHVSNTQEPPVTVAVEVDKCEAGLDFSSPNVLWMGWVLYLTHHPHPGGKNVKGQGLWLPGDLGSSLGCITSSLDIWPWTSHCPSLSLSFLIRQVWGKRKSHALYGEGDGTPLQYSCLENPMDGGAWWAAVHGVSKSRTRLRDFTFTHWRRKWQPTPVFLPGESQGRGSLVGCRLWGCTGLDTAEAT